MRYVILNLLVAFLTVVGLQATSSEKYAPPPHKPEKDINISCDKQTVIAVIDTGLKLNKYSGDAKLCNFGHTDFTRDKKFTKFPTTNNLIPTDLHGHGTNVAGVIEMYAGNKDYCMVILKYYSENQSGKENVLAMQKAMRYAVDIGAQIMNISGGGEHQDLNETSLVKEYLDRGGKMIAAAGNEHKNIDLTKYYPAMADKRVIVVGSREFNRNAPYSNYGKAVKRWENGTNVTGFGITFSGTSQATAIATGKTISEISCK